MRVMLDRRGITAAIVVTLLMIFTTLSFHEPTYDAIKHKTGFGQKGPSLSSNIAPLNPEGASGFDDNGNEKLAYVVLLSGTVDSAQSDDLEKDNYFIATRILVWQLLHVPESRTKHDVIVMITPSVSQSRRDRLEKDGAILKLVDFVRTPHDSWIYEGIGSHQWDDLTTKFRAWQLTQYNRVLLLDGDSMLRHSLDGLFDQPLAQIQKSLTDSKFKPLENQISWPDKYLYAGGSEVWDSNHQYPPFHGGGLKKKGRMNAGFILLHPDDAMFDYLTSFMEIKDSYDPKYNEQALLNTAFDWEGPMPWKEVGYTWNLRCPNENDFEKGLPSMHEKWWTQPYIYDNQKVKDWLLAQRWEMKGWYDGRDAMKTA